MKTTALLFGLLAVYSVNGADLAKHDRQRRSLSGVECTRNTDCPPGSCCTIGYERYSYPRCQQALAEGDRCRPGGPLVTNGSRYYPDNTELVLENVYLMFCPCAGGLACSGAVCRDNGITNDIVGREGQDD